MITGERRLAAKNFYIKWKNKGYELGHTQKFWLSLLSDVFGKRDVTSYIDFEMETSTGRLDAYIEKTKVLIEQKSLKLNLGNPAKLNQTFEQAKRYSDDLKYSQKPKWIVICNFKSFFIYNMDYPNKAPEKVLLKDLEHEYYRLNFLVDENVNTAEKEKDVSFKAGMLVKELYNAFSKEYKNIKNERSKRDLNELCTRLVFCFYAEDSELFNRKDAFCNYLEKSTDLSQMRQNLLTAFKILDTKPEDRDPYLSNELKDFPYVNGGLFSNNNLEVPSFTEEIAKTLIHRASKDLDWSRINPTIFGSIFESTLNPETRKTGGMHYTSVENIHKVIDPLFLDSLNQKLSTISQIKDNRLKIEKLLSFQNEISSLTFLDPACGSGNFLTETYISLRKIENQIIEILLKDNVNADLIKIKVSINNFYGIEINDFATKVAKTALWIAESQMFSETEILLRNNLKNPKIKDFLPLLNNQNILTADALRIDWNTLLPNKDCNYIISNPPFVGARVMDREQKLDVLKIFKGTKNLGNIDYVGCWYKKAAEYMEDTLIKTALVSTNSICQGEQPAILWKDLFKSKIHINFAYKTFKWNSESTIKAQVYCIIVGFSYINEASKYIYDGQKRYNVENINAYLKDAPNIVVERRSTPICANVPKMKIGNKPIDGGNYLFTEKQKNEFIKKEPLAEKYFRPWIGADELINNKKRYCLWLGGCSPSELNNMPLCLERVKNVKKLRLQSKSEGTRKLAEKPTRFHVENFPACKNVAIPVVSSNSRKYIPIIFLDVGCFAGSSILLVSSSFYHFGILTSSVHMAWMRTVCGRLKSDYRYSKDIVYNTFPWPNPTGEQRNRIEKTAQGILDARNFYKDCTLSQLYSPLTMPPELRKAHKLNDEAVLKVFGFNKNTKEEEIVAKLMEMYKKLIDKENT